MRKITADWVFPVSSPPLKNGVVMVDDAGMIFDVAGRENFEETVLEIYQGVLCPGFINAHCHLEGSYMRGKIPEHTGLSGFISGFMKNRNDDDPFVQLAIEEADKEMCQQGIVGVGDISNEVTSFRVKSKSAIRYHTFVECFGLIPDKAQQYFDHARNVFDEARKLGLDASITPHAPYTVTDELFNFILSFNENHPTLFSFHNQESEEENKWSKGEPNKLDQLFYQLGMPPIHRRGESSLKAHLKFFPVNQHLLLVHNTFSSADDFLFATEQMNWKVFFCACPNANLYIENRLPDYSFWKRYSDRVCIGSDSLASNHQLSILEEMKTIQASRPEFPLAQIISWATLNGAKFFGWEKEFGSLDKGKIPGLNLISGVNPKTLQFSPSSKVIRLT